ncbi:MAG: hypothetical protein ACXAD7_18620 [Candidatus Kariarchaeaceae archaeon]|jgi:hypothetical protein
MTKKVDFVWFLATACIGLLYFEELKNLYRTYGSTVKATAFGFCVLLFLQGIYNGLYKLRVRIYKTLADEKNKKKIYAILIILLLLGTFYYFQPKSPGYEAPKFGWIMKDDFTNPLGWENSSGQVRIRYHQEKFQLVVANNIPSIYYQIGTEKVYEDIFWDGYSDLIFKIKSLSSTRFSLWVNDELLLYESVNKGEHSFDIFQKARILQLYKHQSLRIELSASSSLEYLGLLSNRPNYLGVHNTKNHEIRLQGIESTTDIEF